MTDTAPPERGRVPWDRPDADPLGDLIAYRRAIEPRDDEPMFREAERDD